MIKRLLQIGIILAGFAAMPSWGILIDDTRAGLKDGSDVGLIDDFLVRDDTLANSNEITETNFVKTYLESQSISTADLTFVYKFEEDIPLFMTDTANIFASDISGTGSFLDLFIVKNTNAWALFGNNVEMDWAVIDASLTALDGMNIGNATLSHISVFSNGGGDVPEPGIAALLGIGLLGMIVARRRTKV